MSSVINKAGKQLFARHLEQYTPADPLYEEYVDKRGRTKRRKVRLHPASATSRISSRRVSLSPAWSRTAHIVGVSNADSCRTQRQLPPGLSDRDAAILRSVKRRAHHLDKGFNLCGLRFGWSFIIGSHLSAPPSSLPSPPQSPLTL